MGTEVIKMLIVFLKLFLTVYEAMTAFWQNGLLLIWSCGIKK